MVGCGFALGAAGAVADEGCDVTERGVVGKGGDGVREHSVYFEIRKRFTDTNQSATNDLLRTNRLANKVQDQVDPKLKDVIEEES